MIKHKKKFNKLSKILVLIFALLFVFLIYIILRSNFLLVKFVDIKKDINCADENQIRTSAHILGQNFFLVNEKKIESDLKGKFICIKKIHFLKFFPDKINLEIFGREPLAKFVKLEENWATMSGSLENIATPSAHESLDNYLVDQEGIIFAKNLGQLIIPTVYLYDSNLVIGKKVNLDILKILEKVKIFGVSIQSGLIVDNFLIIYPSQHPKIIFRLSDNIDTQIASLQLILEKAKINRRTVSDESERDSDQLEFIDLRFDKPIVIVAPKK